MQRISGFRRMGDPGLEPGTSSLSGKPFVPSSPPNSHLIPANRGDGAGRRGLERTGGYKLVAPSWPHDRSSRARRRMARKRTSRRRYGHARTLPRRPAARLHDRVDRGKPRCVVELVHHLTVGVQVQRVGHVAIKRDLPAIDSREMPQPRPQPVVRRKGLRVRLAIKRPRLPRAATASRSPPDPPTDLAGRGFASLDIHGSSRALATPPRPLRLPFYRNGGRAGEKPAPPAAVWWQASRPGHRVRSAGSDGHGQLRGAHHRGPRAESSSPRPAHTATRGPASSTRWPTTAPPVQRPSPPSSRGRQRAAPTSRLQVHRREPRADSASPCCRSRSSPLAATWSIATKRACRPRAGPSTCSPPSLPTSTNATPVFCSRRGFHTPAGARQPREDDRRAARSRFPVGEAPLKNYLALRGAHDPGYGRSRSLRRRSLARFPRARLLRRRAVVRREPAGRHFAIARTVPVTLRRLHPPRA